MSVALEYLRANEWQHNYCQTCRGYSPELCGSWFAPGMYVCGHKAGCALAESIRECGGVPLMKEREPTRAEVDATFTPEENEMWAAIGKGFHDAFVDAFTKELNKRMTCQTS